jgi:SAM-dependent methyltransferase
MTQPTQQRLNYHPEPEERSWQQLGRMLLGQPTRKVTQRLDAILGKVDVRDKLVADLGCSGGYFSFKIAEEARHVWAVDADAQIIERNQTVARQRGYRNITFVCARISPQLIRSLPRMDVMLFLSVFHHMLTASEAYDWNRRGDQASAREIFSALAYQTQTLVFEIGYPGEGYEWCSRMPPMLPSPQVWITEMLGGYFDIVDVLPPPAYSGLLGMARSQLARRQLPSNLLRRFVHRLVALDPRDARHVFVARHQ